MDYNNFQDTSQPPPQQNPSTATTNYHHAFQQHLQLHPVSQQHGAFLQPHHSLATTSRSPHRLYPHQGGQAVAFLPHGVNPLGFAHPQEGGRGISCIEEGGGRDGGERRGEGSKEMNLLQQEVRLRQASDSRQELGNIFPSAMQEEITSTSHLPSPTTSSTYTTSLGTSTSIPHTLIPPPSVTSITSAQASESPPTPSQPIRHPSASTAQLPPPVTSYTSAPSAQPTRCPSTGTPHPPQTPPPVPSITCPPSKPTLTPSQPNRPPLMEKQSKVVVGGQQLRNALQEIEKMGSSKKTAEHANLPPGFSYMFADKQRRIIKGVKVDRLIQKSQWFGPFNGTLHDEETGKGIESTWELCLRGDVWFYIDGKNKTHNNWLHHINPARTKEEQNLEAFQHYGDIYYRALDLIQPDTELKVFYSDEYREKIGCSRRLEDLKYDKEAGCFRCHQCKSSYQTSKGMVRHIKFCHSKVAHMPDGFKERINRKVRLMENVKECKQNFASLSDRPARQVSQQAHEGHFVCVTCGKNFESSGRLQAHEMFHESASEDFECSVCNNIFESSQLLMRHMKVHNEPHLGCTLCQKKYSKLAHLASHMHKSHRFGLMQGKIVCKGCSRNFPLKQNMSHHLKQCKGLQRLLKARPLTHDSYESNNVEEDEISSGRTNLRDMHENVDEERAFTCTLCQKWYMSRSNVSRHLKDVHGFGRANGMIICTACSKEFHPEDDIAHHISICKVLKNTLRGSHGLDNDGNGSLKDFRFKTSPGNAGGTIPCTLCKKNFSSRSNINRHMMKMHGFGRHKGLIICRGCGKKLDVEEDISHHLKKCVGLQKHLEARGPWYKHRNTDDDGSSPSETSVCDEDGAEEIDRDHTCTICQKTFCFRARLSRHMEISHGFGRKNGRIICIGCSVAFRLQDDLSHHFQCCKGLREFIPQRRTGVRADEGERDSDDDDDDDDVNEQERPEVSDPQGPLDQLGPGNPEGEEDNQKQGENNQTHLVDMLGIRYTQDASKRFKCKYCTNRFFTEKRLQRHKQEKHRNVSVFKCNLCDHKTPYKFRLRKHVLTHHAEKRYKCQLCTRSFASEVALCNHQKDHTDAKPHKCEPCMRAFSTRKLLLSHNRRIHAVREMRFSCSFCDKKFPERPALAVHERRHKGIRPHVCLACAKAFTSKHQLICHMRTHTGEKPFRCEVCKMSFALNHQLATHLSTVSHQRKEREAEKSSMTA